MGGRNINYVGRSKANRPKIDDAAVEKLDGDFYVEFKKFLAFLREEKINTPWKSICDYNMKYEGRIIGGITLLGGVWEDDISKARNNLRISIATAEGNGYDRYLEGLPEEVTGLFMERIGNTCGKCRPSSVCAKGPGMSITVAGKRFRNICCLSNGFHFNSHNANMLEMVLLKHGGIPHKPEPVVLLDTVKAFILAAKRYIEKTYK
jgi:hypothetical protein